MSMHKQPSIASKHDQKEFAKKFKKMIVDYSEMSLVPQYEQRIAEKKALLQQEKQLFD